MSTSLTYITENLRTQDNRATAGPIFAVQERKRIYGLDPAYCDEIVWLSDYAHAEVEEDEAAQLEKAYQETDVEPDGYTRTGYMDTWEFVTACFTEQGCKDYLTANGHNLNEPRIYAYGSYRNAEWNLIRDFLADPQKLTSYEMDNMMLVFLDKRHPLDEIIDRMPTLKPTPGTTPSHRLVTLLNLFTDVTKAIADSSGLRHALILLATYVLSWLEDYHGNPLILSELKTEGEKA